jgi:hypothetical protein
VYTIYDLRYTPTAATVFLSSFFFLFFFAFQVLSISLVFAVPLPPLHFQYAAHSIYSIFYIPLSDHRSATRFGGWLTVSRQKKQLWNLPGREPPDVCSTITIMDDARAPAEKANPGTSSAARAPLPGIPTTTTADGNSANGPLPLRGHELPFVAPSSYLRPKPSSRAMSDKMVGPLDKDQMQGLVSIYSETRPCPVHPALPRSPTAFYSCCFCRRRCCRCCASSAKLAAVMRGSGPGCRFEGLTLLLGDREECASSSRSGLVTMFCRFPFV